MNPAISNPIKITGRPIINNNAFAIPHVDLHAKTINLIDNISIPITNNVIITYTPLLSFWVLLLRLLYHSLTNSKSSVIYSYLPGIFYIFQIRSNAVLWQNRLSCIHNIKCTLSHFFAYGILCWLQHSLGKLSDICRNGCIYFHRNGHAKVKSSSLA